MSAGRVSGVVLILTGHAVELRPTLEPTAWFALEELAISARSVDGLAVSTLSVRLLAERLGRSKDAMARALRHLAEVGLIERLEERDDFSGRFDIVHYCVDLRAAGLRLPAADEGPTDPSTHLQQDPGRETSRPTRRDHSSTSVAPVTGATDTHEHLHRPPPPGSPESTNLHPGAAPGRSRPDPDRRDMVGTHDRPTYPRDPAEPDTLWPDPLWSETDRR
jgi:hypothetical protein